MLALKEWSAVVHALLDGRQRVLLRKGGIGEKRFEVAAQEFLLFPTVAHSHAGRVRPEHRGLLDIAAADSAEGHLVVRAAAKVVAALPVDRPEGLEAIEDLHIWTAESVRADRLDFRPKHKLAVLVVSVSPLMEPVRLPRAPEYAGCTSWVELPLRPAPGPPVHDEAALTDVAARVRAAVGRQVGRAHGQQQPGAAVAHGVGDRHGPAAREHRFAGAEIARVPGEPAAGDQEADV
jgi:hypothetical protein